MRTPSRLAVAAVCIPFLTGCFSMSTVAVPRTAPEREQVNVQGVVIRQDGGGEETIQFGEVVEATWTPTSLSIVGILEGDYVPVTRLFQISTMAGLRVKELDAGKTSAIIGGVFIVTAAVIASVVSGTAGY